MCANECSDILTRKNNPIKDITFLLSPKFIAG
jgi:hypothetical protein